MATPVLPYPNMDFTPLDILTAAEMDQMVANDQYLRDFCAGLADGTNLSDGVIQARKLNLTTLGSALCGESDFKITSFNNGIGTWQGNIPLPKSYNSVPKIVASLSMPTPSGYYGGMLYTLKYDEDKIYEISVYRPGATGATDFTYHLAFAVFE